MWSPGAGQCAPPRGLGDQTLVLGNLYRLNAPGSWRGGHTVTRPDHCRYRNSDTSYHFEPPAQILHGISRLGVDVLSHVRHPFGAVDAHQSREEPKPKLTG